MNPTPWQPQLQALTEANLSDLYRAFGIRQGWRQLARHALRLPALSFAKEIYAFDDSIAQLGLQEAAFRLYQQHAGTLHHHGAQFKRTGPLLILMNHPGLSDILALLSVLDRSDIRIVAAERPLLRALPNMSRHIIYLSSDLQLRPSSIRETRRHLMQEGCLILFARGAIETDPQLDVKAALASTQDWFTSLRVFSSLHPELSMQTAIISGVRHPASLQSPLLRIHRNDKERDWLAATLQLMLKRYRNHPVHIQIAPVATDAEQVLRDARTFIQQVPALSKIPA